MDAISQAIDEIKANGFAIIEDFLTLDQLETATEAMAGVEATSGFGRENFGGTKTKRASNLLGKTRGFDDIVTDERLLRLVEGVLGPAFQISIVAMIKIFPGESPQPLHQDDGLWPAPRPHQPFVLNTMLALDEFSAENGGTNLVPGSHKSVEPVDQEAERFRAAMPRGGLLAWDGACWHGGGASTGTNERCGLNVNYNVGWLRQQENQFVSIAQDVIPTLPERLRRLLGYQHHGILGLADDQDPLEVLRGRTAAVD